jgi:hypothetical protein
VHDPFSNRATQLVVDLSDGEDFGAGRMCQTVSENEQFEVFSSVLEVIV